MQTIIHVQPPLARILAEAIIEENLPITLTIGKAVKGEVSCLFEYEQEDSYKLLLADYILNPLYSL